MRTLRRSECAVLPLVLKKKWYGMIDRGEKKEEYRERKLYWTRRMADWMFHPNRIVAFSRGYSRPTMWFHAKGLYTDEVAPSWRKPHPEWGEPTSPHWIIELGERINLEDDR